MPDQILGRTLLAIARTAIAERLGLPAAGVADELVPRAPTPRDATQHEVAQHEATQHEATQHALALHQPAATFVTLTKRGALRGCIGSLEAVRPLEEDVRDNAIAAAFRDPRFRPLAVAEFANVAIEVSVLSASEPMDVADEADLLAQLRPGEDGLILAYGRHRATFLPQVWDALPRPRDFVAALKEKAGLASTFWSAKLAVSRYTVTKYHEEDVAAGDTPSAVTPASDTRATGEAAP